MNFAWAVPRGRAWSAPVVRSPGRGGAVLLAVRPTAPGAPRRALFAGPASARRGAGDFEATVLPHLDAAYSLARFLARDPDAAEDVIQEAVLKAHRGFASFRGGDAKAWLLTIVRREFMDWAVARRARRAVFAEADGETAEELAAADDESAEARLVRDGEIGAVRRAIAGLPEPFREAIVLRELEEMSYREVAAITGAPIGTVMSRLSRAREMLAQRLRSPEGATRSREVGR